MRIRQVLCSASVVVWLCSLPTLTLAASFSSQPAEYQRSGSGPFQWSFVTNGSGADSGVAYDVSTESGWHRCLAGIQNVSLSGLPDGRYTVAISDDLSINWYASMGQLYSGVLAPCGGSSAPADAPVESVMYVDSTPPVVTLPAVVVADRTVQVSSVISDGLSGVKSIDWAAGDGQTFQGVSAFRYSYLVYGNYTGTLTVTDNAGNVTTQQFPIAVPAPPSPTGSQPVAPAENNAPTKDHPTVTLISPSRQRLTHQHGVVLRLRCAELCSLLATGRLHVGSRTYPLKSTKLALATGEPGTVKLAASRTTLRGVSHALRRGERVRALVIVRVRDGSSATRTYHFTINASS